MPNCYFTGESCTEEFDIVHGSAGEYFDSRICGKYCLTLNKNDFLFENKSGIKVFDKDKTASYLYYHALHGENKYYFLTLDELKDCVSDNDARILTPQIVENWYPKTFAEKIDLILLKLAELSVFDGDYIAIKHEAAPLLYFLKHKPSYITQIGKGIYVQRQFMLDYLISEGFVKKITENDVNYVMQLTNKALSRIYELQKNHSTNKNVFVSMAFNENTIDTREAIRQGIINAGYSPEFVDEIIHNHQIVPEMFRLIGESEFLIMDISDPNYGAYYEAGYALGLGKEVIITCKREIFTKEYKTEEEQKYEKYLKPHFDVLQKQILVWENYADLTKQLTEWIKAIIG